MIPPLRFDGRPATFKNGHNKNGAEFRKGQPAWNKGTKHSPEAIARRTATRRERTGGAYTIKGPWAPGWRRSPESNAKQSATRKARGVADGERNPAWKGGASMLPYGPEFTRKYKRLILERDGYTCQRCGRTRGELPCPMHVHHLDHNKLNNDPTNLVASCGPCNSWANHHRDQPFRLSALPRDP